MAQNYTRQSSFADGDTITAALFNNEFNQVVNAFAYSASSDSSTGHKHDGTSGQGGNIPQIGDIDFLNKIVVDNTNNRWGFYVQVSSGTVEQLRIQDGAIVPVTNNDIDLGTSSLEFKDLFLDGTAHIDTLDVDVNATVAGTLGVTGASTLTGNVTATNDLSVGGNLTVTGNATIAGNLTFGDAATDTVAFSADVASNLLPSVDNTYDLGAAGSEWKDLYIDGTANIDSLVADTADINGGTIDGATIATSDITVGSGKTLNVSAGTLTLADDQISGDKVEGGTIAATTITTLTSTTGNITSVNATTVDTTNLEVTTLKAKDGTAAGSIADSTGVVTLASSVLTTTDINGGTIDSAVIGGTTPAAITGTAITATGIMTATGTSVFASLDISGDIDVDGTANLDVVDIDGAVDMASTLAVGGVVTANAGVVVDNITIDGTTIALSSGDLTLDVAGDLILDADGSDIYFKDGGSERYRFRLDVTPEFIATGGNFRISNATSDADILFVGNDGGSTITALTLDMSAAGEATFNAGIKLSDGNAASFGAGGDLLVYHSSNENIIQTNTSDQDLLFKGKDGASTITALTLDMSAAGAATFNGTIAGTRISLSDGVDDAGSAGSESVFNNGQTTANFRVATTGNANTLFVDGGTNNVGINVADPTHRLEVVKDNTYAVKFGGDGGGLDASIEIGQSGTSASPGFNATAGSMLFSIAGSEAMRIDTSGNLGIGVTPAAGVRLDVRSNAAATIGDFRNASATGFGLYVAAGDTSSQYAFRAADYQNNLLFTVQGDGNVGIGTSSPATQLHVADASDSNAQIRINGSTSTVYSRLYSDNNGVLAISTDVGNQVAGSYMMFEVKGTERMRIDSLGGITAASQAGGHVVFNSNTVDADFRVAHNGGTHALYVDGATGKVGIGASSPRSLINASSATGAVLTLESSDTTLGENDVVGQIDFYANDASTNSTGNKAFIKAYSETAGGNKVGLDFATSGSDSATGVVAMTIDSSRNVGIGNSGVVSTRLAVTGAVVGANIETTSSNTGHEALIVNRQNSFGTSISINKAGTAIGGISVVDSDPTGGGGELLIASGNTGLKFDDQANYIRPSNAAGALRDNIIDLGKSDSRFKYLYLSGGVVFGATGGSVSSKTLDDYEEGTWTPAYEAVSGAATYGTQEGSYTKIGNKVMVTGVLQAQRGTLSGTTVITGLPFSVNGNGGGVHINFALNFATDMPNLKGYTSGNQINFRTQATNASASSPLVPTNLSDAATTHNYMYFTAHYFTAA